MLLRELFVVVVAAVVVVVPEMTGHYTTLQ